MIRLLKEKIENNVFKNVIILTGAGMGVDSGLPDYRSSEGFWKGFPMAKDLGLSFEDEAKPSWFRIDADEAWSFYGYRTNLYKDVIPHEGFDLLKDFVKNKNYFIVTSNIDGLFQKAGFDDSRIYEMHGNIFKLQCTSVNGFFLDRSCDNLYLNDRYTGEVPVCECGKPLRPNIQMFGDNQWHGAYYEKQKERFDAFKNLLSGETLIIEIGAGKTIPFIRNQSEELKRMISGSFLVRINPFEIDGNASLTMKEKGVEGLRQIFKH
jgi:NAD-dependent SIR2 family protein deacetylase